jgi:molecular chaperone GrpE (heat shock protein)
MEILKTVSSPTNDVNVLIPQLELSNNALKATISSGLFLDLSSDVQYAMLRLEKDTDGYNSVVRRKVELRESAILNNLDEQLANKVVRPYDDSIADYVRDILSLSDSLVHLMEHSRTGRGTFKVKSKNAKQI